MEIRKYQIPLLVLFSILLVILIEFNSVGSVQANQLTQAVFLPIVFKNSQSNQSIVVNHNHTDIQQIPDFWIAAARPYVVHFAHTSHGSQILSGLNWLEQIDQKYNSAIAVSELVSTPTDTTALRFYDGNNYPSTTYITPELYWETPDGLNHTRSVSDTGLFDFSLWTWCGQMSYYNMAQIQQYNETLNLLEQEYPQMRFIYFTGHTDGTTPESGSALWDNNNLVREYVDNNQKILFDFADMESFDPDGTFYPTMNGSDSCLWCADWCAANPDDFSCQNLDFSCAHSHPLQCALKAQAFWYLMARMAGWDGNTTP
jgi:hypothetical protein